MKLLTVFTPTYNRKNTIVRTYESLKRQTSKNFLWMVIDDGSSDGTGDLVKQWAEQETDFLIQYVYKKNGGLHTGYNKAIELAQTELMVCIDSDDYVPDNAVELIESIWKKNKGDKIGGIIGLDQAISGQIIGNRMPAQKTINLADVAVGLIDVHGDKKQVVRTDLYKKVAPMPTFEGEKNFNPYYMILQIAVNYEFLVTNEVLCIVDYQENGMAANIWKQFYDSPNSFAERRKLFMSLPKASFQFKFKEAVHYVSSCLIAKRKHIVGDSPAKLETVLATPFGVVLSWITRLKNK